MLIALAAMASASAAPQYSTRIELDKPDGFYKVGEEAVCTAVLLKDGKAVTGETGRFTVKFDGQVVKTQDFNCNGAPVTIKAAGERPGWLYFGVEALDENGCPRKGEGVYRHHMKPSIVGEIGAVFDADKIRPAEPRPADFDAYWDGCRAKLDTVPVEAVLTAVEAPEPHRGRIECFAIEVKCYGARPVTGYLAYPRGARAKSLPACVDFLSAVWQDQRVEAACSMASGGALALFSNWHGLPCGRDAAFYRATDKTWIAQEADGGGWSGDTDRDTWILHDMFYRVMRALDFIKSRPEWDGKNLIVRGGSGGGAQAIAAAALDKDVTMALVSVPGLCDFNGFKVGRGSSVWSYRGPEGLARIKADPRIQRATAYHDGVHFAPRITCDIFVCTGFTDELCTPASVYAFYNALPETTKKHMTTHPLTGHYGTTKNVAGDRHLAEFLKNVTVYE